jgi:hypothetical protein
VVKIDGDGLGVTNVQEEESEESVQPREKSEIDNYTGISIRVSGHGRMVDYSLPAGFVQLESRRGSADSAAFGRTKVACRAGYG